MKRLFFALICCLGAMVNCTPASKETKQTFRVNICTNPTTLDPGKVRDLNMFSILRMLFEGLTRIGEDEKPHLALASSLSISEEQTTYTFTLRESYWTHGEPVVAGDFVAAWKRALDPSFPSDYASQLFLIKNGRAIKQGEMEVDALGVRAEDQHTLVIELERPIPYFLELLSYPIFFPLPGGEVKERVGNGPFRIKKWRHDDELVLEKNQKYWDKQAVHLDQIKCVMVDMEAEQLLFDRGELDWMGSPLSTLNVDAIPRLQSEGKRVVEKLYGGMQFIRINTRKPYLDQIELRKALGYAIDRKEIVEHVTCSGQIPSTNLVPGFLRARSSDCFTDNAKEEARHCLSQVDMTNMPPITLFYCQGKRNHLVAQTLQEQWRRSLGIVVQLETAERSVYFRRLSQGDFDLALGDWVADFNDPINFLEVLKTKEIGANKTGWGNALYTQMLEESYHRKDPVRRLQLLARAEKIMLDEMPVIPLDQSAMVYLCTDRVKDVFISSMGNMELKKARIVDE